jgi:hypothetical protein
MPGLKMKENCHSAESGCKNIKLSAPNQIFTDCQSFPHHTALPILVRIC